MKPSLVKSDEGTPFQVFAPSAVNMQTLDTDYTYTPGKDVVAFKINPAVDIQVYVDADDTNYFVIKADAISDTFGVLDGVVSFLIMPVSSGGRISIIEMKRLVN